MFKVRTHLTHFIFWPNQHVTDPLLVEWYKLFENEDNSESYGICFSDSEHKEFTDYLIKNPDNFHHVEQAACENESTPRCGNNDLKQVENIRPKNVILRRKPLLTSKTGTIFPCMDIQLVNSKGVLKTDQLLPFDIIGKVL